jgi:glycosyltransferase involved in cell wall biosynthesis
LKVLFVLSYYSGFHSSIKTGKWNPSGMPAVSKLFDCLTYLGIDFIVVFNTRQSSNIPLRVLNVDNFNNPIHLISNSKKNKNFRIVDDYIVWKKILKTFKLDLSKTIIYCDRANITIGALFSVFTKCLVFLRLHGVTTWLQDSKKIKWIIYNPFIFLSFFAPFKYILCTEDGSPGRFFLNKYFRFRKYDVWLNGVDKYVSPTYISNVSKVESILFVSRLDSTKGVLEFLELSQSIILKKINIKIIMIGDGPMRDFVKNFLVRNNFPKNFLYLGEIPHSEILKYYSTSSLFISFNHLGNLSNTVLEALSCGCVPLTLKPCYKTKRDIKTYELLSDSAFFVDRSNITNNSLKVIEELILNPHYYLEKRNNSTVFSATKLKNWDSRVLSEVKVILSLV